MNDDKNNPEWSYSSYARDMGSTDRKVHGAPPNQPIWWSRWGIWLTLTYVGWIVIHIYFESIMDATPPDLYRWAWWREALSIVGKRTIGFIVLIAIVLWLYGLGKALKMGEPWPWQR